VVKNGIAKDQYIPWLKKRDINEGSFRILVEGPLGVDFKNVEKTIALCRMSMADEIWLLTSSAVTSYPGVDKVFSRIPISQTPEVYGNCDLLVKLSYVEGMFGPPLEMFHCGGTAIVYNVSGHDEYIMDGFNALVAEVDNEEYVVECINKLYNDRKQLRNLQHSAVESALEWHDWAAAGEQFEACLSRIKDTHASNRQSIINRAEILRKLRILGDDRARRLDCGVSAHFEGSSLYRFIKQFERRIRHRWTRR